jgi:hypothetical protein
MTIRDLDKNGVWRAMTIAIFTAMAGLVLLGWQYRQLEEKRLPALEKEIQRQEIERTSAQNALERFMSARLNKREAQAALYLTENAAEQERLKEFTLLDDYDSFKILSSEKLAEEEYRFVLEIRTKSVGTFVEIVTVMKILDNYYINSIQLAG